MAPEGGSGEGPAAIGMEPHTGAPRGNVGSAAPLLTSNTNSCPPSTGDLGQHGRAGGAPGGSPYIRSQSAEFNVSDVVALWQDQVSH